MFSRSRTRNRVNRVASNIATLIFAGVLFGFTAARLKGSGTGLRYELGNVATLWLVVPLLICYLLSSTSTVAVGAFLETTVALVSFYVSSDNFGFSAWTHVYYNRLFYLVVGSLLAAFFAAFSYILRSRHLALLPIGVACLLEPFISSRLSDGSGSRQIAWLIELLAGMALLSFILIRRVFCLRASRDA